MSGSAIAMLLFVMVVIFGGTIGIVNYSAKQKVEYNDDDE